jgi:hypothetical protein
MSLLRKTAEGDFDYGAFRRALDKQYFSRLQRAMLHQRLALLDGCIQDGTPENRVSTHFKSGQLTIIECVSSIVHGVFRSRVVCCSGSLSSPFMDASSARGFFDLVLGLYVEADIGAGKFVVLDEAHKVVSPTISLCTTLIAPQHSTSPTRASPNRRHPASQTHCSRSCASSAT